MLHCNGFHFLKSDDVTCHWICVQKMSLLQEDGGGSCCGTFIIYSGFNRNVYHIHMTVRAPEWLSSRSMSFIPQRDGPWQTPHPALDHQGDSAISRIFDLRNCLTLLIGLYTQSVSETVIQKSGEICC